MSIRDELDALADEDGLIHPQDVVEWARSHPDSELYQKFEWDLDKAAMAHWLYTARRLISVYVVYDNTHDRRTISLVSDRRSGGGYRDLDTVLESARMRYEAAQEAVAEIKRWRERVKQFTPELDELFDCIDRFRLPPFRPQRGRRGRRPIGPQQPEA
jgi:hypothetical protein